LSGATGQAEQSLQAGDLQAALRELQEQVRANPADAKRRVFLFQLLSVVGEWGRALTQLDVAGELDAGTLAMVQTYREALRCEVLRRDVFQGKRSPLIFGDPEEWVALALQALQATAAQDHARATELRERAFESAPASAGSVDGHPFAWIADADSRIGPFLEVVLNGNYYWVPFRRIRRIQLSPPEDLRDLVWTGAEFTWANGGQAVGLIPTRYPGSESSADNSLRLARKTDWLMLADDEYAGIGQRMLVTDENEYPLLEVREIVLDNGSADADWSAAAAEQQPG
jgi:type VI secretion system protein ImpE